MNRLPERCDVGLVLRQLEERASVVGGFAWRDCAAVAMIHIERLHPEHLIELKHSDFDFASEPPQVSIASKRGIRSWQRLHPVTLRMVLRWAQNTHSSVGETVFCELGGLPMTPKVLDRMFERHGLPLPMHVRRWAVERHFQQ